MATVTARPPTRSRASTTVTVSPAARRRRAAAIPAAPAPITATSASPGASARTGRPASGQGAARAWSSVLSGEMVTGSPVRLAAGPFEGRVRRAVRKGSCGGYRHVDPGGLQGLGASVLARPAGRAVEVAGAHARPPGDRLVRPDADPERLARDARHQRQLSLPRHLRVLRGRRRALRRARLPPPGGVGDRRRLFPRRRRRGGGAHGFPAGSHGPALPLGRALLYGLRFAGLSSSSTSWRCCSSSCRWSISASSSPRTPISSGASISSSRRAASGPSRRRRGCARRTAAPCSSPAPSLAGLVLVPVLNLLPPLFGVALMVHVHKRLAGRALPGRGTGARPPARGRTGPR